MFIRQAQAQESTQVASLILLAMEDIIYHFIGEESKEKAIQFLASLVEEKGNQYSFENSWVVESEGKLVAATMVYDGAQLEVLRKPVLNRIKTMFDRDFMPEDETQAGEFYIDCIGVDPNQQGKGLGSKILLFLVEEYVEKRGSALGLLVDKDNPHAKKLYLKLGFKVVGEKTLSGKELEHLQVRK